MGMNNSETFVIILGIVVAVQRENAMNQKMVDDEIIIVKEDYLHIFSPPKGLLIWSERRL